MNISRYSVRWRQIIHKPLIMLARIFLKHRVKLMQSGYTPDGKPTIFAFTHIFKDDIASVLCSLQRSAHLLCAGETGLQKRFEGALLRLNGVIWVDRGDKTSRTESMHSMKTVLHQGGDILIAPEANWNHTPNLLVLKMWWGLFDVAIATNANIVPVAVDLIDNRYCVLIGEKFNYAQYSKKTDAIVALRDTMATMVWELFEMKAVQSRTEITDECWLHFIRGESERTPWHHPEMEERFTFRPMGEISLGELLAEMHGIDHKSMAADYETHKHIERLIEGWTKSTRGPNSNIS